MRQTDDRGLTSGLAGANTPQPQAQAPLSLSVWLGHPAGASASALNGRARAVTSRAIDAAGIGSIDRLLVSKRSHGFFDHAFEVKMLHRLFHNPPRNHRNLRVRQIGAKIFRSGARDLLRSLATEGGFVLRAFGASHGVYSGNPCWINDLRSWPLGDKVIDREYLGGIYGQARTLHWAGSFLRRSEPIGEPLSGQRSQQSASGSAPAVAPFWHCFGARSSPPRASPDFDLAFRLRVTVRVTVRLRVRRGYGLRYGSGVL